MHAVKPDRLSSSGGKVVGHYVERNIFSRRSSAREHYHRNASWNFFCEFPLGIGRREALSLELAGMLVFFFGLNLSVVSRFLPELLLSFVRWSSHCWHLLHVCP